MPVVIQNYFQFFKHYEGFVESVHSSFQVVGTCQGKAYSIYIALVYLTPGAELFQLHKKISTKIHQPYNIYNNLNLFSTIWGAGKLYVDCRFSLILVVESTIIFLNFL